MMGNTAFCQPACVPRYWESIVDLPRLLRWRRIFVVIELRYRSIVSMVILFKKMKTSEDIIILPDFMINANATEVHRTLFLP